MREKILGLAFALLGLSSANAAPVVTSLSGAAVDDQLLTISGSGFGTVGIPKLWLGGKSGTVDSQANGVRIDAMSILGLSLMTPSTQTYPHVSTEKGWSNGKSIAFDVRGTREYKQTLFFDIGSDGYSSLYTNAIIYLQHDDLASGSYLQWKMMRWTRTATVVDGDGAYMSNRPNAGAFFTNFSSTGQKVYWFGDSGTKNLPGRGAWYRYETWLKLNSSPGTADGKFRVKVTNSATGAVVVDNSYSNVAYNGSGDAGRFRYLVLQNYFGNAGDSGSGQADNANASAWWDDVFVSTSEARVELCDKPVWSQCTNREIQPATLWGDGKVSIRLNKGALATLSTAYLYVTNDRGEVNAQGYALDGSVHIPLPPSPLSVQ